MAGPSVMVRVLGDVTGLVKSVGGVGPAAEGAASKASAAFGGMLGTLNKTGVLGPFGESLATINEAIGQIAEHGKTIGAGVAIGGAAAVAVGGTLAALGSKDQAAHQQLQQAIENTGKSYDDFSDQVDKAVKHNEKFGDTAVQTQNALQTLTQATGDPTKGFALLGEATDLAAAKHEDLTTAAVAIGKVYNGNTKTLKEFGIATATAVDTTNKVAAATKTATTADDNATKAKQHLADVHALLAGKTHLTTSEQIALRDAQQKVTDTTKIATDAHQKLAAMHETVVTKTQANISNTDALAAKLKGQASAAADTFTGRLDALKAKVEDSAAAFGQKYGPAITAAGSAMTVAGGIMTTFTGIKEALTTATEAGAAADDAAAVSEGLALAPILLIIAAIAILVVVIYELVTHWKEVWATIKAVAKEVWDWLKTAASDAMKFVTGLWDDLVKFITGIPDRLGKIFSGMFDGLKNAGKEAFNFVANAWNNTIGSLSFKVPGWVPVLGGDSFSAPHIPTFATGGIVTSPTLALIGENGPEAVVPLGRGTGGPVIHIEHAAFNDPVDVELLSKQIEFALSAGLAV